MSKVKTRSRPKGPIAAAAQDIAETNKSFLREEKRPANTPVGHIGKLLHQHQVHAETLHGHGENLTSLRCEFRALQMAFGLALKALLEGMTTGTMSAPALDKLRELAKDYSATAG